MREGPSDRRRLYEKLVRELVRCEARVAEHAPREAQRIGDVPPVLALQAVSDHAIAMRPRLGLAVSTWCAPGAFATTMTTLRARVVDRMIDAERAYRGALLDLR